MTLLITGIYQLSMVMYGSNIQLSIPKHSGTNHILYVHVIDK